MSSDEVLKQLQADVAQLRKEVDILASGFSRHGVADLDLLRGEGLLDRVRELEERVGPRLK